MATKEVQEKEMIKETSYDKAAIINSKSFMANRDILKAILDDDKTYTLKQVSKLLEENLKKEVH